MTEQELCVIGPLANFVASSGNVTAKPERNEFNLHWWACMRRKATRITANSVHETMASVMENGKNGHKFNRTCVYTKFAQITQKPLIQSNVPLFAQLVGW